ncbi:hypothetical protein GQR58_025530 [Nymphon striatum]|nr:hypothetical protein GQR58_025530 [Nymphon striatum]
MIQTSYIRKITGLGHLNYWEQLKDFRLNSLQRRRERYLIIYTWCMLERQVPNIGMVQDISKRGRRCLVPPINQRAEKWTQKLIESSLKVRGPMLFNIVPKQIRNMSGCKTDVLKRPLEKWLANIPDEPQISGYTAMPSKKRSYSFCFPEIESILAFDNIKNLIIAKIMLILQFSTNVAQKLDYSFSFSFNKGLMHSRKRYSKSSNFFMNANVSCNYKTYYTETVLDVIDKSSFSPKKKSIYAKCILGRLQRNDTKSKKVGFLLSIIWNVLSLSEMKVVYVRNRVIRIGSCPKRSAKHS